MGKEVAFLPERKTKEAGKKLTAPSPRWQPHSGTRSLDKTEVVFKISPYGLFSSGGEGAVKPGIGWVFFFFLPSAPAKLGCGPLEPPQKSPDPFFLHSRAVARLVPRPAAAPQGRVPVPQFPRAPGLLGPGGGGLHPTQMWPRFL